MMTMLQNRLTSVPSVDSIAHAAQFLAIYLESSRSYLNPTSKYLSSDWCASLLQEQPELYSLVEDAHKTSNFEELEKNALLCLPPLSWSENENLTGLRELIDSILELGKLKKLAEGDQLFKETIWQPCFPDTKPSIAEHIRRLEIPAFEGSTVPCLLVHDLGSFSRRPELIARLDRIFHSKHTLLLNASATGKTRLLFEGLCMHWGFYFTAVDDSSGLGSLEIHSILSRGLSRDSAFQSNINRVPNDKEAAENNRKLVRRRFSECLWLRLLIFKNFLQYANRNGITEEHKRLWLIAQLRPQVWGKDDCWQDVFADILNHLKTVPVDDQVIDDAIMETVREILALHKLVSEDRLYIVLDEANAATHSFGYAFRDADGRSHSILQEIIDTWLQQLAHLPVSLIIAGTEMPRHFFKLQRDKWSDFTWCSDTGAFDHDEEQRRYLSTLLPAETVSSTEGQELLERAWKWLRGRHRFTAAFVTILLQNDFQHPHVHLNNYIEYATQHRPPDALKYDTADVDINDYFPLSMSYLEHARSTRALVHEAIVHIICHMDGFESDDVDFLSLTLAEHGYGRFIDPFLKRIVLDEPLMTTSIAEWFGKRNYLTDLEYFNTVIDDPKKRQAPKSHRSYYLTLLLTLAFETDWDMDLSEIFEFPITTPGWARQKVQLVVSVFDALCPFKILDQPVRKLVTAVESIEDTLQWIKRHDTPFCVYQPDSIATVLFALKLADGTHVWVVMHILDDVSNHDSFSFRSLRASVLKLGNLFPAGDDKTHTSDEVVKALKALPDLCPGVELLSVLATLKNDDASITGSYRPGRNPIAHLQNKKLAAHLKPRTALYDRYADSPTNDQKAIDRLVLCLMNLSPKRVVISDEPAAIINEAEIPEAEFVEGSSTSSKRLKRRRVPTPPPDEGFESKVVSSLEASKGAELSETEVAASDTGSLNRRAPKRTKRAPIPDTKSPDASNALKGKRKRQPAKRGKQRAQIPPPNTKASRSGTLPAGERAAGTPWASRLRGGREKSKSL